LKLTEMRSRRDVMVVVFLMYFLLVTHFLFSQELWTIVYLLLSVTAITALLIDVNHTGEPLAIRQSLRLSAGMISQALPLMLLFFILFPRIPGPLWGLPSDAGPARSGLSDSMSPGDIASLTLSDEVAFRVSFNGPPPAETDLYWRGPVFRQFNGRSWTQSPEDLLSRDAPQVQLLGGRVDYELTLEPMRSRWLLALDMPDPTRLPAQARLDRTGALVLEKPLTERRRLSGVSHTRYQFEPQLSDDARARDTALPARSNPRTQQLAAQWRSQGLDDGAVVAQALGMFREQDFFYTLQPPALGWHAADEFLFETRRGYCEHYASAFVVLMRAAGIPARVVTGYQGMEANNIGNYYVVRQSDAHAWAEVWLQDRGWVRIDPTSSVAPERIERSVQDILRGPEINPGFFGSYERAKFFFEARWDWVNARWNEWVLAYGPEMQMQCLSWFGLADLRSMILALTIGVSLVLALVGLTALRRAAPPPVTERALLLWRQALKRMRSLGFEQRADEGPRDFVLRVVDREPQLGEPLHRILDAYLRLRYAGEQDTALERDFATSIKRIRRPYGGLGPPYG
ncbi:MAG: transglutaminase TgpA family protein, partial [Panacagrimonas sp.]